MTRPGPHARAPIWTPAEADRWPHFKARELACKGSGEYWHDPDFLDALEALRAEAGRPLVITSGHRSARHNRRVGGAPRSMHLTIAADIALAGHDRKRLLRAAIAAGFTGLGLAATFLHVDRRPTPTVWPYAGSMAGWDRAFGFNVLARVRAGGLGVLL
jgi:hypothetical protein